MYMYIEAEMISTVHMNDINIHVHTMYIHVCTNTCSNFTSHLYMYMYIHVHTMYVDVAMYMYNVLVGNRVHTVHACSLKEVRQQGQPHLQCSQHTCAVSVHTVLK